MGEKIIINNNEICFILQCDAKLFLQDIMLQISLKRLNFNIVNNNIEIPFDIEDNVKTLQDIIAILQEYKIPYILSESTSRMVANYANEIKQFEIFTEKARTIRNDEFENNPDLLKLFEEFQNTLKEKITNRKLYPLQLLSSFHMAFAQNSCNFSVPWAWKTSIVYWAYAYLKSLPNDDPKHVDKLLIVWPTSSFKPWELEYKECFGKKATVQRLSWDTDVKKEHKIQHLYSSTPAEISLIHHGYVHVLVKEIKDFLDTNKTMIVVDEAHRIKNDEWIRWTAAIEIAKVAKSRVILTWTPLPNWYEDLFNLYQFIYPYKFREILKIHKSQLKEMSKSDNPDEEEIKQFIEDISPYFIRIKKKDLKLPWIKEQNIIVEMDESQRKIYDFIEAKYIKSFKVNSSWTIKDKLNQAKLIRLRQAAINPGILLKPIEESMDKEDDNYRNYESLPDELQDDSEIKDIIIKYISTIQPPKFIKVKDIIEKEIIPNKQKVIVWTIFIQNAKELQTYLQKNWIKSRLLIWEIQINEREEIITKFNDPNNDEFEVIIANPFSVAESISLHKWCHNAIYIERDYSCSNFIQSKDRIHRVWLKADQITNYYYILSKDSIDEIIAERLNMKVKRMEKIINSDIPLFTRLDNDDENDLIQSLINRYAWKI